MRFLVPNGKDIKYPSNAEQPEWERELDRYEKERDYLRAVEDANDVLTARCVYGGNMPDDNDYNHQQKTALNTRFSVEYYEE